MPLDLNAFPEIYLRHAIKAREILAAGRRAINDVKDLSRGSLRVGWTPITDYITCSLLKLFRHRYPGITISTFEMPQDDIEIAVAEDKIDFGIAFGQSIEKNSRLVDIEKKILFQDQLCLAIGDKHPLYKTSDDINVKYLEKESLALLNTGFALRTIIDEFCHKNKIKPLVSVESNSLNVIIEFIQAGTLSTILRYTIVRSQSGINSINLSPQLPTKAITLAYRNDGYTSPACKAFKKLVPEWVLQRK